MTTRKPAAGKTGAKKLKVKKQTLKDLDPKGKKKLVGGYKIPSGSCWCGGGTIPYTAPLCLETAMTNCRQITCADRG